MGRVAIDLTGQRFGRWGVTHRAGSDKMGQAKWACECDCGNVSEIRGQALRSGVSKSCGCWAKELRKPHGHCLRGKVSPEYRTWQNMHKRVAEDSPDYDLYGARGITVCARWDSFKNFLADMGERPSNRHSIDRIDNDLGYFPANCRWATVEQQCRNKRNNHYLTHNGVTMCLMDWSKKLGLKYRNVYYRFHRGYSAERILNPVKMKVRKSEKATI